MSFSWVDPHFTALFAQREEERVADRLTRRLRERAEFTDYFEPIPCRRPSWIEQEIELRGRLRLI